MTKLESIDQLYDIISAVKAERKGFLTNFYLDEFKHNIWIHNESLYYEYVCQNTCFIIRKTDNYWNVFYVTVGLDTLRVVWSPFKDMYNENTLIFYVVGRIEHCNAVLRVFYGTGFVDKSSLVRMIRITEEVPMDGEIEKVQRASVEQAKYLREMLFRYMDETVEQIPDWEEYEHWCKLGHILIYSINGKIAGFLDFEKNKTTMMPRHWLVLPEYRGCNVGSILYRRFLFEANDVKRTLSWVIRTNDISIKSHHRYGFIEENMFDYIIVNKQ